ncbi:hypothetical protein [Streptomyces sp. NPDC017991]|uniref:hypothetical protein n=1 Tax=Streptomyces sp. NPDC017991 TaxID=3365026 RepID=UPI003792EF39
MKNIWTTCSTAGIALAAFTGAALAAPPALGASRDEAGPMRIVNYKIEYGSYTAANSINNKTADAVCPLGTVVLGGGGQVGGAPGLLGLRELNPRRTSDGRYRFTAAAAETGHSTNANWRMRAVAVCGKRPAGYEITDWRTSVKNHGTGFKAATATCPSGKKPLGYGAKVLGGPNNVSLRSMVVLPWMQRRAVQASASEAAVNTFNPWSVSSRAVCATSSKGQREYAGEWFGDGSPAGVTRTAACPAGRKPLGAGMAVSADRHILRNLLVRSVYPFRHSGGSGSVTIFSEDWNGTSGPWKANARVICAP